MHVYLLLAALLTSATAAQASSDLLPPWSTYLPGYREVIDTFRKYDLPFDKTGATAFALLYGYPLQNFTRIFTGPASLDRSGTNKFVARPGLSQPSSGGAGYPNVDTLYAFCPYDLYADLVLDVPRFQPNRFYSFAFYDPFGGNYAALGTIDNHPPGKYLITSSRGSGEAGLSPTSNSTTNHTYAGQVRSPTLNGLLFARVAIKLVCRVDKPFTTADLQNISSAVPEQALQLTARLHDRNPPQDPTFAAAVTHVLRYAGLSSGEYFRDPAVDLSTAYRSFNASLDALRYRFGGVQTLNNGWYIDSPTYQGGYDNGTDIVARSFVSRNLYAANTPDVTIYLEREQDSYALDNDTSYIITFAGGKPDVHPRGFWSFTLYNVADGSLVANREGVYSVSDRSNVTYPDGTRVYGGDDSKPANTPFQILIQSDNIAPPANWTQNWLPGPTSGEFTVVLRYYLASEAILNGTFQQPIFEQVRPIRG